MSLRRFVKRDEVEPAGRREEPERVSPRKDGVDHEIGRTIKAIRRKHRISRVVEK
jgi:hypothetical protein